MPFIPPFGTPPADLSTRATIALDNLASVAINTSLISDTDSTDDLGSSSIFWANAFIDKLTVISGATIDGTLGSGTLATTGAIIPTVDEADNLGAATFAWNTLFAKNIDDPDGAGGINFLASIDLGGNRNIDNANAVYITERADADLDIGGNGQLWVNTATPNEMFFTDDAGTDFRLGIRLYEAVVDAAGGADYTTIEGAFDDSKTRVFVRNGTYNPAGNIIVPDKGILTGESKGGVIIDFQDNARNIRTTGAGHDDIVIETFTVQNSQRGGTNGAVTLLTSDRSIVRNIHFAGGNDASVKVSGGNSCIVTNNHFSVTAGVNDNVYIKTSDNAQQVVISNNTGRSVDKGFIDVSGASHTITGNVASGAGADTGITISAGASFSTVTGNSIDGFSTGIVVSDDHCTIVGNFVDNNGSNACIQVNNAGDSSVVMGNVLRGGADGVNIASGASDCIVVFNNIDNMSDRAIDDSGTDTQIYGNYGSNEGERAIDEKKFMWMKNTAGHDLVIGDVVTYKAVAAGDELTTTTTLGDDLVYGMAAESISENANGKIQVIGKTTALKVDGTTDIAVGDFIASFSSTTIGYQAASGDMAFAIALEAYTTDDSAGVIDALLITPRKL